MRTLFPGHYRPQMTFAEALENALVVFDTNALLNFYGLSETSRQKLFDLMERLPNQRWIPHQVALEFHRNRIGLIDKNNDAYHKIPSEITSAVTRIKQLCDAQDILRIEARTPPLLEAFANSGQALIDHLTSCGHALPKHSLQDSIAEKFADLFESRVGAAPISQEALNSLCEEGDSRYEAGVPPGFGDKDKKDTYLHGKLQYKSKFGDLIIWRQIINHVKSLKTETPRMLMYVTDDAKKDWWLKVGSNALGPRPELAIELNDADPKWSLWMYTSSKFFQEVAKVQDGNLDKTVIADVEHAAMAGQLAVYDKYFDSQHDEGSSPQLKSGDEEAIRPSARVIHHAARNFERRRARDGFMTWLNEEYKVLRVTPSPMPSVAVQAIVISPDDPEEMPTVMLLSFATMAERVAAKRLQDLAMHAVRMSNPVVLTLHILPLPGQDHISNERLLLSQLATTRVLTANGNLQVFQDVKMSAFVPDFQVWSVNSPVA